MWNYITTKIKNAFSWSKDKIRWFILGTTALAATSAVIGLSAGSVTLPITYNVDGQVIELNYTDDNTGEDLYIVTDTSDYVGLSGADMYFTVFSEKTSVEADVTFLFSGSENVTHIQRYMASTTEVSEPVYETQVVDCVGAATSTDVCYGDVQIGTSTTIVDTSYWEDVEVATTSETVATTTIFNYVPVPCNTATSTPEDVCYEFYPNGSTTSSILSGKSFAFWGMVKQAFAADGDKYKTNKEKKDSKKAKEKEYIRIQVPKIKDKQGNIASASTFADPDILPLYRARVDYDMGTQSEFFIEAIGSDGSYGHLDPWFDSSWLYKQKIEINPSNIGSTLTNFPVYIDLSDMGTSFFSDIKSDGCDIRVTESDQTTETAFELVSASTTAETGELWALVDSASSTATTTLYIYYGNSGASCYATTDTYGSENVWGVFELVDHFEGNSTDSTSHGRDGTDTNISYGSGRIGQTAYNTSKNGKIATASWSLNSAFTVSAWLKLDATTGIQTAFSTYNGAGTGSGTAQGYVSLGSGELGYSNFVVDIGWSSAPNRLSTEWAHVYWRHDGTTAKVYINGTLAKSGTAAHATTARVFNWLSRGDESTQRMDGYIDEARVVNSELSLDWLDAEYVNQSTTTDFYFVGEQISSEWYDSSWTYRMPITADDTLVDADLTDYPAYYDCSNAPADFWSNVNSDLGDVRITTANGAYEVAREIVSASTTAETCEIHFLAPNMYDTASSTFYIYFGNSGASDYATTSTYGAQNVWSNYVSVFHGESDGIDAAGTNNLTAYNSPSFTSGKLGNAPDFTKASSQKLYDSSASGMNANASNHSHQLWLKTDTIGTYGIASGISGAGYIGVWTYAGDGLEHAIYNIGGNEAWTWTAATDVDPSGTWYAISTVRDGAASSKLYIDGSNTLSFSNSGVAGTPSQIGMGSNNGGTEYFDGMIDELRISNNALGSTWISTEYNNQSNVSAFWSVGAAETEGGGGGSTSPDEGIIWFL